MRPDILKLLAKRSGLSTFDIKSSPDDQGPSADYYGETAADFGQSQYDTPTSTAILTQPGGLDDLRGQRQTNLDKFGNGLVGMVGKTLTTAAEGIINPFYGTVAAIADGKFSTYYNNDFTKSLDDFNKTIDESNPFYETREEAESTGFAKLWHANTLFRDVLGGAGTSVGAALTGSAYMKAASLVGKALGAGAVLGESAAVLKEVQAIDKSTDALRYVANQALKKTIKDGGKQGVIALLSATAEAGAEGREQIKNIYHNLTHNPDGSEKPMSEGELNYAKLISEQAGDMVFGLNLPVIMADNWISFGKNIWGNKTNDFAKIVGEGSYLNKATGLYEAISKGKGDALKYTLKQIGKPMLAEGNQEMLQFGVGKTASDYYQKKYYNKNAANFADSFTKGMAEAYTTQEGYSAGIIGALSAGLTSPGIVLVSQGRKAFKDEYITNPDNKTVADGVKSLNDYKAIDVRKKYVDNLVRSANLTEDKDAALEANDDFNYHNANDDLLFSYIHNRLKNGKLEETKNELSNFSQLTAAELEEGYGIKINEGNKSKVESLLQRGNISQFVQEKLDKISKIEDTYNSINKLFPKANPDVKELLVYSAQGIDNAKARKKQLNSEITSVLNQPILEQLFKNASNGLNDSSVNDGINNFMMSSEGVLLDNFSEKYALLSKEEQGNFKKFVSENNDINENVKDELLKKIDDLALLDARQKDFVLTYKALKDPKNQEGFISMSEELWGRYANMLSNKQNQDDEDNQETTDEEEVAPPEVDENGNIIIPSPDQTGVPGESPKGALTLDEILAKGNAAPLDPNNPEGKVDYSADSFGEGDTFLDENGLSWTVVKNKDGNLIAETKGDGLTQGTTIDNIKGINSVVKNPETANKAQYDQLIEKIKTATNEELERIINKLFEMNQMTDSVMNLITARRNYLLENPKKEGAVIPQNETKITEKTEEDIADNLKFGEQPFDQHNDSQLLNEEGLKEDSSKGFTSVINVVMMKIFKHVFDSNGIFRFVHSNVKNDEFPIIENVNNISVKALNEIKKGDKVELKLTNLTAKQAEEIKSVDGFAIGLYFKDELIGFVSEPNKDSSKVINKTEFEARRNALIAYRNSIIKRIKNGETVTETIQKKSNGNLYTKTKSKNGNLSEIVSDRNVLNTIREKDKINGMPIFVVIDKEGNVILPPNNLPKSATEEINKRIDHFNSINRRPNSYKVKGKIMQLVKDLNNEWSLIPIYPGKMNEAVVNKITEALNGFNEQSDGKEIITALNPFIYASLFKKTAVLMVSKDETTGKYIFKINGVEGGSISLEDFNKGGALAKEFKNKLLKLKQNIAINKINTANGQKEMLANENLTSNVYEAPHGEYFVQPFLQYTQKQVSESKPSSPTPTTKTNEQKIADLRAEEQTDLIKAGINLAEFKDTYGENQGNMPDDLYAVYKPIYDKYNALITQLSESNVTKDATSTNIGLITPSDAKKINDIDTDVLNNDNALSRTPDMTKLSREKFIRYLKSKLPQLSLSELNEIYDLKDTMVDAVGLFKDRVIYLFEGAGMKTAYHEAFHGVFRNLLTPAQREKIISQAREKFVAPTNEELINLQKGLKNLYTKEQLTYLYYEEKLADYFGEYTYNKNDKNLLAKIGTAIRDFFNKIFSIFKIFRNLDTSSIESVFDSINNGKLANLSSQSTSVVNLPIMDEYAASKNLNKIYKSSSTKQRMVNDAGGYFQHIYKTSKISGNTKKPSEIFNEIYQTTLAQMLESKSKIEDLEKEKIRNPSPELDSKLLKEQITAAIAKLTVLNFVEFSEEVKKFLSARGVNIKSKLKFSDEVIKDNEGVVTLVSKFVENSSKEESIEDSIGVSGENQEDDEDSDAENFAESANKLDKGIGEMTSISGESSASTRIKIFLDTIPILNNGIQVKNSSGWPLYHNFNDIYYYIERNLIDKYSLVEQLDVLNELSQVKPELSQVIELLGYKKQGGTLVEFTPYNNSEEELDALRKDFKTNFSKQMLSYTLVVAEKNKSTNEIKIKIMNSNRSVIKTEILDDWKKQIQVEQLRDPERLALNIDENGAFVANKEVGKSMFEQMTALVKKDEYIKPIVYNTILKKLGIAYSSKTIEFLTEKFNTKGAPEEVELAKKQLNDWKKTLLKVAEKISNGVVNDQSFRIVFESLANEEAKTVSDRHSASFLNGENKNIWAIQLPSFMSKTISKIKNNDTFQAYIDDLQKDPFYKNSPLLKALDEPKLREIINISYLDSLKQDNGSDGVVYTKITDEDFLISSVALYFNNFQNTKRETGSSATVHKYMYLTNSDKSMAPIVDWISYGVNINEEGKIVASSPIVGEMYNVFTQEVDRINHNKNLISNIIKTKDFNKLNKLKDYYHLSIENFRTLSKYIAETKDAKDANWDEIGKLLEQKSGSAFKFNYFDNSKISKLLEGDLNNATEQKIKNFITEYLNELAKNEKADWIENGLIAMKDGKLILNNLEKPYYSKPGDNVNDIINKMIAQYSSNTLLNNIQFSSIFNGDVAGYKIGDIQKRTPQSSALVSQGDFGDNRIIRTIVKKDHYSKSESYFGIKKGLESLGLSKEKIDKIVNSYLKTNATDSQVFITPAFFKRVLKSRGLWNDKIDLAFRIAQGQVVGSIDSSMHTLLGALKPFYNGNRFDEELGIQVFEQVKCSMMPLFKTLIADSPLLLEKAEELKSKRADMIAFDSSFKGFLGYRDEVGADPIKDNVIELSTDNFGIQVENPNHIDSGNDATRQMKMQMVGTIDVSKTFNGTSGQVIRDNILLMESTNITESLNELSNVLNGENKAKFMVFVKDMITKRGASINVEEALTVVKNEFLHALDNGVSSSQVENMISSVFTNRVIKQKFKRGGSAVQATSLGFKHTNLKEQQAEITSINEEGEKVVINEAAYKLQSGLKYMEPNPKTGETGYIECAMPADKAHFFTKDGFLKDITKIPKELLQLVAYRIPTEPMHSMMAVRVVKFFPPTVGNFMLLPYEVTTQLGADFDFDKIYFIGRDFHMAANGDYKIYSYNDENSNKARLERFNDYNEYNIENGNPIISFSDFAELSIPLQNSKGARDNEIVNNYLKLLTSIENLPSLVKPSGFDEMTKFKNLHFGENETKPHVFFTPRRQRSLKRENHTSRILKGIWALHISGHSYASLMPLSINRTEISNHRAVKFNNIVENALNNLYNVDKDIIAEVIAAVEAAVLDDVKNPLLEKLNINAQTSNVLALILRAGFNLNTMMLFSSQPVIRELSKKLLKNRKNIRSNTDEYQTVQSVIDFKLKRLNSVLEKENLINNNDFINLIEYNSLKNLSDEDIPTSFSLDDSEMLSTLNNRKKESEITNKELAIKLAFQLKVLVQFKNYQSIADPISKTNEFFAINKEAGPNIEDIIQKNYVYNDLTKEDGLLTGFDINEIPTLKATWEAHKSALRYMQNYFPFSTTAYNSIKKEAIRKISNKSIANVPIKTRNYMNNFIRIFSDYKFNFYKEILDEEELISKHLPFALQNMFKPFFAEKTFTDKVGSVRPNISIPYFKNNDLRNEVLIQNLFLSSIKPIWDEKNKHWSIQLKANRVSLPEKNNIIDSFTALYQNKNTQELAKGIIKNVYLHTGMHTGVKSIHGIISPELLEKLGYDDYRKKEVSDLNFNKRHYSQEERDRLIDQMIRNNPKDFTKVYEEDMFLAINGKDKPLEIIKTNRDLVKTAKKTSEMYFKIDGAEENPIYIRVYNKRFKKALLYKLSIKDKDNGDLSYKLISPLGRKAFKIEANPFEDIINSTLPNNNNASAPEFEEVPVPKEPSEMNSDTKETNNKTFVEDNNKIKEPSEAIKATVVNEPFGGEDAQDLTKFIASKKNKQEDKEETNEESCGTAPF